MAKNTYRDSPFGPVLHPHVNKPDDKFNKENPPFHGELVLKGDDAIEYRELIDQKAKEAFDAFMEDEKGGAKLTPAERKKWSIYVPYEVVEDDNGDPTGEIKVDFKQNSVIRTADGVKKIEIGLYDANGDEMKDLVRHGSIVRFRHSFRAITLKTNKQVGVRLDFSMVQVKEMAKGSGGGGFGKVDGGYTKRAPSDQAPEGSGVEDNSPADSNEADY